MKLIGAEGKKLFSSRIIRGLFCSLLLLSLVLTLALSRPHITAEAIRTAFADIIEDPEGTAAYYEHLCELNMAHFRDESFSLPHTYLPDSEYDDWTMLENAFERLAYIDGYPDAVGKIIRSAELRRDDLYSYGFGDGSYEIRAQQSLISTYGALLDKVTLEREYAYGYDVYLETDTTLIFVWLFVTAAVSYIFLNDNTTGFHAIMKTTRRGRLGSAGAKLVTTMAVAAGSALLFEAVAFLAVGITTGYSSPFSAIQLLPGYETVPYAFSMLSYTAVHIGFRMLAFTAYALFLSAVAAVKPPYVLCFAAGTCFTGINLFPALRTYAGTAPAIRYLNGAAMATGRELMGFWRTVNLGGFAVSHAAALLLFAVLAALLFGVGSLWLFCRDIRLGGKLRQKVTSLGSRAGQHIRERFEKVREKLRPRHISLGAAELKKSRFALTLLLAAVLLGTYYLSVRGQVGSMATYGEALYYNYISELRPLDNDECVIYLTEERSRLDGIINAYSDVQKAYETGDMPAEAYFEYLELYGKTYTENEIFKKVETYISYLQRKNPDTGIEGKILYTSGYEKFFGLSSNLLLYAILLFFASRAFTVEYGENSGFSQILRTTAKGRRAVFRKKLFLYTVTGCVLAILFRGAALLAVADGYIMTDADTVLYSVQSFSAVTMNISIRQYLFSDFAMQALTGGMLALFICAMSFFCRRILPTLCTVLLITGVPEALARTALKSRTEFSPLSLTAPARIFNRSATVSLFSADAAYLLMLTAAFMTVVLILVLLVRRLYVGQQTR